MISPRLRSLVDEQLVKLRQVRFSPDPLLGSSSALVSILASAPKRHGPLIEAAIIEALTADDDYRVWTEKKFIVPVAADHAVQSQTPADIALTRLPYGGVGRPLQIDLMAYSRSRCRLGAYEIKRGNGAHDAGKLRSLRRDVYAVQSVLASYGNRQVPVEEAISRVIFYYGKGRGSLPSPWTLTAAELDRHFGCCVVGTVEGMTDYFRERLEAFVDEIDDLRPDIRQLALL